MCSLEMLLLLSVTLAGGFAAAMVEPAIRGGRLLMVLGASFAAAVAALFAAGLLGLPSFIEVPTTYGTFWLGWALLGSLGASASIIVAVRRHLRGDEVDDERRASPAPARHSYVP